MAPLYQHTNRQKIVVPTGVNNTNYSVIANAGLSGSPTQFGFFALPTNTATDSLFDVTVTSVTIT